jgi:hypothetical protein
VRVQTFFFPGDETPRTSHEFSFPKLKSFFARPPKVKTVLPNQKPRFRLYFGGDAQSRQNVGFWFLKTVLKKRVLPTFDFSFKTALVI